MFIAHYNRPASEDYVIDFESFYDEKAGVSVKNLGNLAYASHPDREVFLVSITRVDATPEVIYVGPPEDAPWEQVKDGNWWAWNAGFDKAVYEHGLKFPRPAGPNRWDDAAALAAFMNYPRDLQRAMKEFDGTEVDKSVRKDADTKRRKDFSPDEWAAMLKYNELDGINAARFIYELAGDWPEEERDLAMHTVEISTEGVEIDWDYLTSATHVLQRAIIEAESALPWVTEYDMPPLSPKGLAIVCRENKIEPPKSLAQDSPDLDAWVEKYGAEFEFVSNMQRRRCANGVLKKLGVFEGRRRPHTNRIDYGFKYCGAHTGRWTGDAKTNLLALNKDDVEGVSLRAVIVAPPGKRLAIFDWSQIEPRCLAWLCGDTRFLKLLQQGLNPYEAHAASTMSWVKDGSRPMKESHSELYKLAKARVLGLGYGCGKDKFIVVAKAMAGLVIDLPTSTKIVRDFRESNKPITNFWTLLETALKRVSIKPKGERNYALRLPSGRFQTYYSVECRSGKIFAKTERGGYHNSLWGGKLCENVTQAVARDVLRDCLINLTNAGHKVLFHVYDEVILEVDEDFEHDPERVAALKAITNQTPDWLPGCPMDTEWTFADHYLK